MTRRLLLVALLPLVGLWFAPPAAAHDSTTTARAVAVSEAEDVRVVLELEYDLLMKSAWLYARAYEVTDPDEQLRQLQRHEEEVAAYVVERFQVAYDEQRCAGRALGPGSITERDGRAYAALTVGYDCAGADGGEHAFFSALFPDEENFVHSTRTLLEYDVDGVTGSAVLDAGTPRHDLTAGPAGADAPHAVTPAADGLAGRSWDFAVLGAEHLLLGPDHLLFLLALLIGARGWRDVAASATAFTAAHSVTFGLAALGLVTVPSAVVEPLIAASVVVVALMGLRRWESERGGRWRITTAFGFGLLHGLGFAGSLGIDAPGSWELLWSLLAFNVGIEVTQLVLVVLVFPLLLLVRRLAVGSSVITAVTVAVAVVGAFWLLQRLPATAELMARATGDWSMV